MTRKTLACGALTAVVHCALLIGCTDRAGGPSEGTSTGRTGTVREALTTCSVLSASGDAMLSNPPMNGNFGAQPIVRAGGKDESLVRFDLGAIPPSAVIESATLKLYVSGSASDAPINVHRAAAAWAEGTVTYASFGQRFDATVLGSVFATSPNVQKSVDLTPLVTSWVTGAQPNFGVLLEASSASRKTIFVSREGGVAEQKPALQVCYTVPGDHCAPNPCQHGATCENGPSGFLCHCAVGYTGTTCGTQVDDCANSPCQNGGTCTDGVGSYSCACAAGYAGSSCEIDVDDCAASPCHNGGVCEDGVASHTCHCLPGYSGANCETLIDNCGSQPCQNGATCTNGVSSYVCTCAAGFTGANCEINVDDCTNQPCHNGGTCIDGINAFTCSCPPDWGGATCDVNLNKCSQNPCLNGSTCTNGSGNYTCACAAGFTGTNCEIDVNDCAPNPCLNGGLCIDGVNGFTCQCSGGNAGRTCEITEFVGVGLEFETTQGVPMREPDVPFIARLHASLPNENVRAMIDWGDGSPLTEAHIYTAYGDDGSRTFSAFSGPDHWYAQVGTYDVTVTFYSTVTGASETAHSTAHVLSQFFVTGRDFDATQGVIFERNLSDSFIVLATFTNARDSLGDSVDATIDWGDGTPVAQTSWRREWETGQLQVIVRSYPEHWYAETGTYDVVVTVHSSTTGATATGHATAHVGPQFVGSPRTIEAIQRQPLDSETVLATFTDARETYDTIEAFIDWGDGSPESQTAWRRDWETGELRVIARPYPDHFYVAPGTYPVIVTVKSTATGASLPIYSTINVAAPVVSPGTTELTLSTPPAATMLNHAVTFDAIVQDVYALHPVMAGTVTFLEGTAVLGGPFSVDGAGHAAFTTSMLAAGVHSITATYSGTATLQPSTATIIKVVERADTNMVVGGPTTASLGENVSFSVVVQAVGTSARPDGQVVMKESGRLVAGPTPLSFGAATLSTNTLPLGTHQLTFEYQGASQYAPSWKAFTIQIVPPPLSIDISSHPVRFTTDTNASFAFSATNTSTFECELDLYPPKTFTMQVIHPLAPCSSPTSYSGLHSTILVESTPTGSHSYQGAYSFLVVAHDAFGQTSTRRYSWEIQ
jgi:hypothetical protein